MAVPIFFGTEVPKQQKEALVEQVAQIVTSAQLEQCRSIISRSHPLNMQAVFDLAAVFSRSLEARDVPPLLTTAKLSTLLPCPGMVPIQSGTMAAETEEVCGWKLALQFAAEHKHSNI